jgi:hypothetical protein
MPIPKDEENGAILLVERHRDAEADVLRVMNLRRKLQ